MDRRRFLAGLAPALAATRLSDAFAARATIAATPLGGSLTLLTGGGGNVVAFASGEGLLLVDGGSTAGSTAVLQAARGLAGNAPVHTLFNTHWHHDQTGSNAKLGAAGARIIAHENTKLWLATDVESKWEQRVYAPLPAKALPNQTFFTDDRLAFGGEQIEYGLLPQAHTDGDLYVHFRSANVIVAGDVLARDRFPVIDYCTNGWVGGLLDATTALLARGDANTRYVAGTGAPLTRAEVEAERDMLQTMKQRLSKLLAQGMSVEEMLAADPAGSLKERWGDPTLFIRNAFEGLVHRAGELGVNVV